MTVCADLLALMATLSSKELEDVKLKLSVTGSKHLLIPCSLSDIQLIDLICELRRISNGHLSKLLEPIANLYLPETFATTSIGPAEVAYTVPPNTVSYVNIRSNACGTLRKVVTTVNASRVVPNQWKAVGAYFRDLGATWTPTQISIPINTGYGASSAAADAALQAKALLLLPASITWNSTGWVYLLVGWAGGVGFKYLNEANNSSMYVYPVPNPIVPVSVTLYYLDTTVTWTYEIV